MSDIEAATAVEANVLSPKTFIAGDKTLRTGTMPTVAITASSDTYPTGYHAGNAGGLDAIDTDLAPANIKSGVTIFGKAGTLTMAIDKTGHTHKGSSTYGLDCRQTINGSELPSGGDALLLSGYVYSVTAGSAVAGVGTGIGTPSGSPANNRVKIRLFIDNVQVAESGYINTVVGGGITPYSLSNGVLNKSGSVPIKLEAHNHGADFGGYKLYYWCG